MGRRIKLEGKHFGLVVVQKYLGISKNGHAMYECVCDCGKIFIALGTNLKKPTTKVEKSCGCQRIQLLKIARACRSPGVIDWDCPDAVRKYNNEYRRKNIIKAREAQSRYAAKHKPWKRRDKDKERNRSCEKARRGRENLNDTYIKATIKNLEAADIPPKLIELKRAQLIIHRALKQIGGI